jgi:hypothetical protein
VKDVHRSQLCSPVNGPRSRAGDRPSSAADVRAVSPCGETAAAAGCCARARRRSVGSRLSLEPVTRPLVQPPLSPSPFPSPCLPHSNTQLDERNDRPSDGRRRPGTRKGLPAQGPSAAVTARLLRPSLPSLRRARADAERPRRIDHRAPLQRLVKPLRLKNPIRRSNGSKNGHEGPSRSISHGLRRPALTSRLLLPPTVAIPACPSCCPGLDTLS